MSVLPAKSILAIDPGSAKCGLALVRRDDTGKLLLLWRKVERTDQVVEAVRHALTVEPFQVIVVGSGTTSRRFVDTLRQEFPHVSLMMMDERDTTLQARERYWEHHPRRGWRKLLPASMQNPPEAYDDFAALVLAERVLTS